MTDLFAKAAAYGVLPVIAIEDAGHALALADALVAGGLPVAEITFRTAAAAEVMRVLRAERPDFLVGAGTILDLASLEAAKASGAEFGLAPGFDPDIVEAAQAMAFPFAPGVMTPSDISGAVRKGCRLMKFFPAGTIGGPTALEGISAPFAHLGLSFIPTGGVSEANMSDWLKLRAVSTVGGTWIARPDDIRGQLWSDITAKARSAVETAARARSG